MILSIWVPVEDSDSVFIEEDEVSDEFDRIK